MCFSSQHRALHQLQIPHSQCHRFYEKCGLLMREQSCVSFTPAITSSLFTLLRCRRQTRQKTWSAEDEKWMIGSGVMENISAVWRQFHLISASKDCLWFPWFCPLVLRPKRSACIMLSRYKSGTDALIFMQPVASVRRLYLKSPSGSCAPKITSKSKNSAGDILRIFWRFLHR